MAPQIYRTEFKPPIKPHGATRHFDKPVDKTAAQRAIPMLGACTPLSEAPFGGKDISKVREFAAYISRILPHFELGGSGHPLQYDLLLKQLTIARELSIPINLTSRETAEASLRAASPLNPFNMTPFGYAVGNPRFSRAEDGIYTPQMILSQRSINVGPVSVLSILHNYELAIIAVAALRFLDVNAYVAGIVPNGPPVPGNFFPAVAVLDKTRPPYMVTSIFGSDHLPMSTLDIYPDAVVPSFLHTFDAMNRLFKFNSVYAKTVSRGLLGGIKSSMLPDTIIAGVNFVCEAIDESARIWRGSPILVEAVALVTKVMGEALPKEVQRHFQKKIESYVRIMGEYEASLESS